MGNRKKKTRALKRELKRLRSLLDVAGIRYDNNDSQKNVGKPQSPLAPQGGFPRLPVIGGVQFSTARAQVRYADREDVMLVRVAPGSSMAGVFTQSSTRSAAVADCVEKLSRFYEIGEDNHGFAILVNSGNANAFTGSEGFTAVRTLCDNAGALIGIPGDRVLTSSTGVIGEPLPVDRIVAVLKSLSNNLAPDGIESAARAIVTTDTFHKGAMAEVAIDGRTIRIAGIAKGSGMIAPDMATMLAYVFTDAAIPQATLQSMVSSANENTFNSITVDGDTSTSDTVLVAATGVAGAEPIRSAQSDDGRLFSKALESVMSNLAKQIVRDGEGGHKVCGNPCRRGRQ